MGMENEPLLRNINTQSFGLGVWKEFRIESMRHLTGSRNLG
jgi:hypothetical protein